jgi:CO/xanthine dehydrogenase FAD-binding subunit
MITDYHRPQSLQEALKLLSAPNTHPLGGGTVLTHPDAESFAVVDLQALGLDRLHKSGNNLEIGATVTLQALLEYTQTPTELRTAIKVEAPLNLRNMGTVAGTLVTCDGRSPFAVVMLALDAKLTVVTGESSVINLGDLLLLRHEMLRGKLITRIEIPLQTKLSFETVARSPVDKPIICAALAQWPSGRTRLVIGGWGNSPSVAMDGNEVSAIEAAARNAAHDAADEWASAKYRSDVAAVLAKRCLGILLGKRSKNIH